MRAARTSYAVLGAAVLAASGLAFFYCTSSGPGKPEPPYRHGSPGLALYAQAVDQIGRAALFVQTDSPDRLVIDTLKAYLAQHDPYSDVLDAAEYAAWRQAGRASYAGIGMELEKRRGGGVLCYPLPGSPAALAGVVSGERLATVNGVPASGKSLAALAALITGPAGSALSLEVVDADGRQRLVSMTRAIVNAKTISDYRHGALRIIRLSSFAADTRRELDLLVSGWNPASPLVIDLRGCGGGDFHAAVDAAMLFLRRGERIVSVQRRSGTRVYTSTLARSRPPLPVYLWQDGATASAAEVFIAALVDNARAISVGATSAGKGTLQEIIPLAGGAALVLTTASLSTPNGRRFDGQGLAPMQALAKGSSTDEYARQVRAAPGPRQTDPKGRRWAATP